MFYLLMALVFFLPYGPQELLPPAGAWNFLLSTISIVALASLFLGKRWWGIVGLPSHVNQLLACILAGVASFFVFYWLINLVLTDGGYQVLPQNADPMNFYGRYPKLSHTVQRICQPLNEEIVLRALLLGFFARFFKHRAYLALLAALVFSLLHFLLYYYGALATKLELSTLFTLFFFGLAANALYLTFHHIGFGFVIHFAWNWWRFRGPIVKNDIPLNEAQGFNILEGSTPILIFVTLLSLICVAGLIIHDSRKAARSTT